MVVIGGGLTAIDTATESLAYYVRQVEKFAARYRTLVAERGEAAVRAGWNAEEAGIADEFLAHAAAIATERDGRQREGRAPRLAQLLDAWGGATIAYRRRLIDSPSYTLNHEEVAKALEEAVRFAEGLTPRAVEVDGFGHAAALRVSRADGSETMLPARAILVAAGTQPNTVLAREDGRIRLDGRYFQAVDETGAPGDCGARPRQARCDACPDASRRQRPLHQLLRRPASELLRQCRQGDGRCQARLSGRVSRARRTGGHAGHRCRTDRALSARPGTHACMRCTG